MLDGFAPRKVKVSKSVAIFLEHPTRRASKMGIEELLKLASRILPIIEAG
jgi:hypothetical protein